MSIGPRSLTGDLAAFASSVRFEDVPAAAVALARDGFIDCIGVMLAGSTEPVVRLVHETLSPGDKADEARLFLGPARATGPHAALVNGVASHVLDYDDVAMDGHPSAVLVPAILAEADATGAGGREMLTAYVAGYEVWAELFERQPEHLYDKGWHPTTVYGAVAGAAAIAVLRHLDAARASNALAIAGSMAAGVLSNFGTMTKSFQVGRAAQSAVIAARLAAAGMTGAADALEHPRGFLTGIAPARGFDLARPPEIGRTWRLPLHRLSFKRYPVCYCAHRAIDAMLDLVAERRLRPESVARVEACVGETQLNILRNRRPTTGLEAKFSIEFPLAAALIAGRVGVGELTDEFVQRPEVQAMLPRVSRVPLPDARTDLPFSRYDQVRVELTSGERLESGRVEHARGAVEAPLTREDMWTKFRACTEGHLAGAAAATLFAALERLEHLPSAALLGTPTA